MASGKKIKQKKGREVYSYYREKLGLAHLNRKEFEAIQQNLEAIARAVCEHVWGKKFY